MRSGNKFIVAALLTLSVPACGMADGRSGEARPRPVGEMAVGETAYDSLPEAPLTPTEPVSPVPARATVDAAVAGDGPLFLGNPYAIDGKTYVPANVPSLDEVGYAAMLPDTADGRRTANGEPYDAASITAAHRTLPLPSYVEVTAIATGRTILVRVNDRGPLLADRIIALSPGAAQQLGIATDGSAGVRVRKVNPTEQDRRLLRSGARAAERFEAPPGLRMALEKHLPPKPMPLGQPVHTASGTAVTSAGVARPVIEAKAETVKLVPVQPAAPPPPVKIATPPPTRITPPPVKSVAATPPKAATPTPARIETPQPAETEMPPAETALTLATQDTEVVSSPGDPEVRVVRPIRGGRAPAPAPGPTTVVTPPAAAESPARPARGGYVVQVAALSSRNRADALARSVGGYVAPAGSLFRVRTGPYASDAAARAALGQVHGKGYAEARVMANDAR